MKNVLIFRHDLGALTEGYVLAQGEGLEQHRAYYLGVRRLTGWASPPSRTFMIGGSNSRYDARALAFKLTGSLGLMTRRLRALEPRLIHAHFGQDAVQILRWSRRHHVPLVITFHGSDALITDDYARRSNPSHRAYVRHKHVLAGHAARVIAVSRFVRDRLIAQGYPADRCVVHYIGVDVDELAPDPAVPREPIVLFVGRLVPSKGARDLISAMHEVQQQLPRARLVIIGDGPLREELQAQARRELRACEFLGALPHARVIEWMKRATVVSVPSVVQPDGSSEGLGLVFAEAQAVGTPVVSCFTGGIPEVVEDGETGYLVRPGDAGALASRLVDVLGSRGHWDALSAAARKRMCTQFDQRRQTRLLEAIYDDAARESAIATK
ncbi:MAG: glycosyltransferase [Kofleriaceae bacterium]